MQIYLYNKFQASKVNGSIINYTEFLESLILGTFLFNIFLNDIFFFVINSNLENYADEISLYSTNKK